MKKFEQWFDGLMIAYEGFLIMMSMALAVISFIGMINTNGWEFVACFAGFVFFLGAAIFEPYLLAKKVYNDNIEE